MGWQMPRNFGSGIPKSSTYSGYKREASNFSSVCAGEQRFGLRVFQSKGSECMMKKMIGMGMLAAAVLLTGCATRTKMAFENEGDTLTANSKPVLLMTVTLKNHYKTSHQPKLLVVNVEKPDAKESSERFNFTMDDKAKAESDKPETGNNYFIRMELEPGPYKIMGLTSTSTGFLINGYFFAPLHSDIVAKKSGVYYLGHVDAIVRERKGEEFRAGSPVPLIDQAVVGASGGTFDVTISDAIDKDEALFRARFPALKGVTITKDILPAFDRAKAQAWWQAH
ncbi:hypothetical protein [Rhodoferax sp.]|uniref:hypothetical protein n=1 Tax=Rhodoferax sp. TaxID=50421 RepID=UPI002ACDF829|nr:hypothetical protein [Rhodoferax sp.]MDZ7918749.1 hypothetical protein [Rhodoferax sp.]